MATRFAVGERVVVTADASILNGETGTVKVIHPDKTVGVELDNPRFEFAMHFNTQEIVRS